MNIHGYTQGIHGYIQKVYMGIHDYKWVYNHAISPCALPQETLKNSL